MAGPLIGAIDLGGTKIRSLVVDTTGAVHGQDERPTNAAAGPAAVIDRMAASLRAACAGRPIAALGVASPGPLDIPRGLVVSAANLPGWRNVPLAATLGQRLGVPVLLENDANAAAWGEFVLGAGRGTRHMIYVTVSTGIGSGLVLDGRLYRGVHGAAGELGHMPARADGDRCGCGLTGCLETVASGPAMVRAAVRGGLDPAIHTLEQVAQRAAQGDAIATAAIQAGAAMLGRALGGLANLFDPDMIVVGGGVTEIGPLYFESLAAAARQTALRPVREHVQIVPAALGKQAGARGVALLARDLAPPTSLAAALARRGR